MFILAVITDAGKLPFFLNVKLNQQPLIWTTSWSEFKKSLLLNHIPIQSIKPFTSLPLITLTPNLTMTKSSTVILNFIILICQVWHLISALLTCAHLLEGYCWFSFRNFFFWKSGLINMYITGRDKDNTHTMVY